VSPLPAKFGTDIAAALGAVAILAPFAFSFAGESPIDVGRALMSPGWPSAGLGHPTDITSEGRLIRAIRRRSTTVVTRNGSARLGGRSMTDSRKIQRSSEA
jgi:hypothetical protein